MRRLTILFGLWLAVQPAALYAAEVSFSPTSEGRVHSSVESLLERRWRHVVKQGVDISCGSAALATLLNYHFNDPVTENAIIEVILKQVNPEDVRKHGGFSLLDLKRVGAALGYTVTGYKLSLKQIAALGVPVLIPITIREFKHFVIFRGMVGKDRVVLADPAFGNTVVERDEFEKAWKGIALVLVKKGSETPVPSGLDVAEDNFQMIETGKAVPSFLRRAAFTTMVRPGEL